MRHLGLSIFLCLALVATPAPARAGAFLAAAAGFARAALAGAGRAVASAGRVATSLARRGLNFRQRLQNLRAYQKIRRVTAGVRQRARLERQRVRNFSQRMRQSYRTISLTRGLQRLRDFSRDRLDSGRNLNPFSRGSFARRANQRREPSWAVLAGPAGRRFAGAQHPAPI